MECTGRPYHDAIIDFLPDSTFVIDREGRVIAWNKAMETLTGVSAEEMLGKGDYEYALPFYGERKPLLANLILSPDREIERRYDNIERIGDTLVVDIFIPDFRPGGIYLWAKASPLYDAQGTITGAIETVRDITDRKRAAEEIIRSHRNLADLINFLPDATFAIDQNGVVITWNQAIEEMTGISAAAMMGKGDYEYALPFYGERRPMLANLVLLPAADVESRYSHVQREGDTLVVDTFIPGPEREGRYYWAKASPRYDPQGKVTGAIETIRDITERRKMEERLARSNAELAIAAEIQRSFLPDTMPQIEHFDIAARSIMAKEVGGDFFDVIPFEMIPLQKNRLGILIADVSGKGMPAALFMALSRIVVRVNATWHQKAPAAAIRDANAIIAADSKASMFITLFYGILDTRDRSFTYVNAGHNPPLICRGTDGSFTELPATGMAMGALTDAEYTSDRVVLGTGDVLVLYTDGITEAENAQEQMFGEERFRQTIASVRSRTASEIVTAIVDSVHAFTGSIPQSDDMTLMVVRGSGLDGFTPKG
ncbi:MAG: SpoIIE family protein phosphatase [Methanomicrobiales archaeon]|nr:SpoIIE family protein phosphatase [Methanomicrobiales archaeon]